MKSGRMRFAALAALTMIVLAPASGQAVEPGVNSLVAYDSYDPGSGNRQVFVAQPDGTGVLQLTDPSSGRDSFDPSLSPRSGEVVYTAYDPNLPEGNNPLQLRVVNADGTDDRLLTSGPDASSMASYTPQGNGIVFKRDTGSTQALWRAQPDGSFFRIAIDGCCFDWPTFSTQVTAFSWVSDEGLTVMLMGDPRGARVVAPEALSSGGRPSWSPAGDRIAFVSGPVLEGEEVVIPGGIHSIDSAGDRRLEVAAGEAGSPVSPAYSADGTSLAFVVRKGSAPGAGMAGSIAPAGTGINIGDFSAGTSSLLAVPQANIGTIDWGFAEPGPVEVPEPEDPNDPPAPPPECGVEVSGTSLIVSKRRPVYRLVAGYRAASGDLRITVFRRTKDGDRGIRLGQVNRSVKGKGVLRKSGRVGRHKARVLRRSHHGFIARVRVDETTGGCSSVEPLGLTDLERDGRKLVWSQPE